MLLNFICVSGAGAMPQTATYPGMAPQGYNPQGWGAPGPYQQPWQQQPTQQQEASGKICSIQTACLKKNPSAYTVMQACGQKFLFQVQ